MQLTLDSSLLKWTLFNPHKTSIPVEENPTNEKATPKDGFFND